VTVQTDYLVSGMTCQHCANAVTSELSALSGVTDVTIDLVPDGSSTVTVVSSDPLTSDLVAAALDEAGDYTIVES
jgi:copper chaperone